MKLNDYFARSVEGSEPQTNLNDHSEVTWFTEDTINALRNINGADDAEYPHVVRALEILKRRYSETP